MTPVTTIGGYLGAGKTTLINHLLRNANGRRLAVLVNEFGALSIDEDLIEARDDAMISIAGGCICCSFGDDLTGALTDLAAMTPAPDQIVIEASGVAIPGSIAAIVSLNPSLVQQGVVVLADAQSVRARAGDKYIGDTISRQLKDADLVVLSKRDLCPNGALDELQTWISDIAKKADVIAVENGQVSPEAILRQLADGANPVAEPHSDQDFESLVLHPSRQISPDALANSLAGMGLTRAKGFAEDIEGNVWEIQVVGNQGNARQTQLSNSPAIVCIAPTGQLDRTALRRLGDLD